MSVAIILGTRPEWLKCKLLIEQSRHLITPIYVLQHADLLNDVIKETDLSIDIRAYGTDRLANIISSILHSDIWTANSFKSLIVQGDTVVAYAGALAAYQYNIPVIHLEAGLRTYDLANPWPEEGYRKMIDAIATVALCPSNDSAQNLLREGFSPDNIHVVGNTSIDAIREYNLTPRIGNKVLVTLHRRENWSAIKPFFETIERIANKHPELEFILPIHPNPLIRQYRDVFNKVTVCEPMAHRDLCTLLAECNCIISDSGGIQEEAAYLGKHVFCCRKVTERTELIAPYLTFTPTPDRLSARFVPQSALLPKCIVYGEGDACLKVHDAIKHIV